MSKFPLSCKDRRTQKRIKGFSELEIDVAWKLVQMSRDNYKNDKSQQGPYCQGDASYNDHAFDHAIFEEEEENVICEEDDDGYPKRRNKRFRSIDHIYKVTQPLLPGVLVHSKKVKLSCT
ncbi:hypothetical protein NC651_021722 [Populus alba x Populus x berolinensis]|nr:hypothetical protein NC651_021722 [Populus alba x Populus x berolinensis]